MIIAIFFILGLMIGSFINVLVYRLNVAESFVSGRSKCPKCHHTINWYDNIPVISFVLLKFQCRSCKEKISWQYPLVELSTGLLFATVASVFFNASDPANWSFVIYLLGVISALVVIFVYDLLYLEIPDVILWPAVAWALAFGLFFNFYGAAASQNMNLGFFSKLTAAGAAFAFFFLLSKLSKEKWMGMGDAYLAILLGLILGWPQIILALFLAFFIGSIYGIILILAKMKTMKSQVPFAPFLVLGTLIALFFYESIISWYLKIFYF